VRIGIVAYWFNRGQGVVARQLRSALDSLGHETSVLARPTRKTNIEPSRIDSAGVWAQAGVTAASDYLIPIDEYVSWAAAGSLEIVLFDQNYQFDEIAHLRDSGVRTAGRFVWEQFSAEHVDPARRAFDTVYSLTACEQERYGRMGIDSPRVRWGCHPDVVAAGLEQVTADQVASMVIAYEPIWAIGTGKTASDEQAQEAIEFVRSLLRTRGESEAESVRILYGGSVKPGNAGNLLAMPDIDGALVGGAALDPDDFAAIVAAAGTA